ncbi:MAG: adenosylcobalamin-dependent ribonucleoside-diphosphate reductase [Pyrodictiaceae archaeon]
MNASNHSSDHRQLELIKKSIIDPEAEIEAKLLVLRDIYSTVVKAYRSRAPNGGRLASLPPCVQDYLNGKRNIPCEDDMLFTYNAIRVLMARYMTRDEYQRLMETPSMVMRRVAEGFASRIDPSRLYELLSARRFMFNSPTLFNMYADGAHGTLSACYVTPVYDDMESIMDATMVQALTFKWGGGQGFSFSMLRPRYDVVKGTSSTASGPLSFMRLYDIVTEVVKQGGKRRGANMGIMHAWHPDIINPHFDPWRALRNMLPPQIRALIDSTLRLVEFLEAEGYEIETAYKEMLSKLSKDGWETIEDAGFIQAKEPPLQDANLTNFNISVAANDAFMEAVLKDKEWWMVNPRYSGEIFEGDYRLHYTFSRATGLGRIGKLIEKYEWLRKVQRLGVFEEIIELSLRRAQEDVERQGMSLSTKNPYAWHYPARKIWEKIVENAWASGDPGLFFLDNHNKWIPTPWLGLVAATNPCGEEPLYSFESCNLGSMSIEKYISNGVFDVESFARDVELAVDALDAVIDLNVHPDPRQDKINKFTRKIGLGIMGLADALAKLGYPYDSDEAVAFTLIVTAALEVFAWKRSWELGAKLGHAPAFECKRFDWGRLECVEQEEPEKLVELHTPALLKAGEVASIEDGWLKVKYHEVEIPGDIMQRIRGEASKRLEPNGAIRLVPERTLDYIAKKVFGVAKPQEKDLAKLKPGEVVRDPRRLLSLAIWEPALAWKILIEYGRSIGARAPRNTAVNTVAPTGTISIIAGTSSGIEPYFALVYKRRVTVGEFLEVIREFRDRLLEAARRTGISMDIIEALYSIINKHKGSLRWALGEIRDFLLERGIDNGFLAEVEKLAKLFATSMDFDLWYHLAHQIAAQLYVDQAISKTINLRKDAPKDEVYTAYLVAWLGGLKGVTVYRDESKGVQVIYFGGEQRELSKLPIKKRNKKAKKMRMIHLRKYMRLEEVRKDPRVNELFELKKVHTNGGSSGVIVELTENSTCKTCEY